ncbi:undecaprenyl-diphosphate phosphatase [Aeromicrobium sp.]|nr:undecaprenyl-diphosphate phosphatase [Candidatus Saccharibacteria bacterium]
MITYFQAIIIALVQGATELFPISSLGHSILIANLFGWHNLLRQESSDTSGFLTFLVVLHVATAIALIIFYRAEWVRIIRGFARSLTTHTLQGDSDAKLAWLLVAATIPAGLVGLVFEHSLRGQFAKPFFAIVFIIVNGLILINGDKVEQVRIQQRPRQRKASGHKNNAVSVSLTGRVITDHIGFGRAVLIGTAQIGALFAGISRSGITMIAGLRSGLNHQDSARFSFLLATPIILTAGLYRLPHVIGQSGEAIRGQALVGGLVAGITAYITVRYLDKYFQNRSLRPFGIYCIAVGIFMLLLGIWRGSFS